MRPAAVVRTTPLVVTRAEPRTVRIAVAGCGTVGSALLRLLAEREPAIIARYGVRFQVDAVLVRDGARPRQVPHPSIVTDSVHALMSADTDIVVEAMGGIEPALGIAVHTLRRGAGFITANKSLLAEHGAKLADVARATHARLGFEAAVGGGMPIVRTLRDACAPAGVVRIRGVLNGTTNYLLDRIGAGAAPALALAEAQRLGFAEADPSRDLDGRDAADKLRLLAWTAFGVDPAGIDIVRRGLGADPARLVADARAFGRVVRLIGECERTAAGLHAAVEPVAVAAGSPFAAIAAEENIVVMDTEWNGSVRVAGPGAGGRPTAAALLSDMLAPPLPAMPSCEIPPDGAPHESPWLLSVAGSAAADAARGVLRDVGAGIVREAHDVACARFLTDVAPRYAAELACVRLAAHGLQPALLRVEPG